VPKAVERTGAAAPRGNTGAENTGALRVVTVLVMIGSILGLLVTGFCAVAVMIDGYLQEMFGILLMIAPGVLFFAGSIWVCKALLARLRK
jgi:hypothetical protein